LPKKLCRDYGGDAATAVKKNSWLLLQYKSTGVSRVDKLYLDLGGNPAKIKRQAIILWHCLLNVTTGSTWVTEAAAAEMLRGRIAGAKIQFQRAVELGVRGKLIATRWDAGMSRWLAEGKRAQHEKYIGERTAEMLASKQVPIWPDVFMLDVSDHQRGKLAVALKARWSILGGSPGTGKTYSAARVIDAVARLIGIHNIAACCPTGKAAVRLTEVMQGYGLDLKARTIHSTLGVKTSTEKDGWGFQHDELDPLPFRLIVLDEASMIDTDLFCAFLKAVDKTTQLLIVGDTNQLPPVGHGRPLYDLIAAGVPYGEFTEIRRNAGTVVRACAAIRDNQRLTTDEQIEFEKNPDDPDSPHNLKLLPTRNNAESVEKIVETLAKLKGKGYDPVWSVQVLVATNGVSRGKSELSRLEVNQRLQRELNPTGKQTAGSPFRIGDKVVNLKNSLAIAVEDDDPHFTPGCNQEVDDDHRCYVANGEIGRVIDQAEKLTWVQLDSPLRVIKVPRGKQDDGDNGSDDDSKSNTGCSFDLAYGLSVHKSQGSEFPIVIIGLDDTPAARMVCSRNWIYTGISRAKKVCLLVGKRATADAFCRIEAVKPRVTFLTEEIKERTSQP
jgi:exodeoxyribonuclease V alpha subunit